MKQFIANRARMLLGDRFYDVAYWYLLFRKLPTPSTSKPKLLILDHFFTQDIKALLRENKDFECIILPADPFRYVGIKIFPKGVDSYSVFNNSKLEPVKKRYSKIVERCIEKLINKYHPVAMISPSDNFFYIREFVRGFQRKKIPFIVSDKEGTICPAYFVHYAKYIRETSPLISDYIFVWSERQKDFWIEAGTDAKKIFVVGQPRSDFWRQPDRWRTKRELGIPKLRENAKLLLFFTYDPWSYTPEYMIEKGKMHWDMLRNQTDPVIFAYAKDHPEVDVVIKAHPQQSDIDQVKQIIHNQGLHNVFLVTGPSLSNHLIVNADCVIGFQTTALSEAMNTDVPIIYTFWGEAKDRWSEDLIPFHKTNALFVATSPDMLKTYIDTSMHDFTMTKDQKEARKQFINEYLSVVDGESCKRTFETLKRIIKKHG